MEAHFATTFGDARREWSLVLLLSITDLNIMKKLRLTDHEKNIKKISLGKSFIAKKH